MHVARARFALLALPLLAIGGGPLWAQGSTEGTQFQVNTFTTYVQELPAVASDALGSFVVVWRNRGDNVGHPDASSGQRHSAAGTPSADERQVESLAMGTKT